MAIVVGWVYAALTAYAGRCIVQRKHLVFVLVVSGLNCVAMNPITTTLGVFTFIVLLRPTVMQLFGNPLSTRQA